MSFSVISQTCPFHNMLTPQETEGSLRPFSCFSNCQNRTMGFSPEK
jgi:hypothetical protein